MNVYSENRNSYTIIYGAGSQQLPGGLWSTTFRTVAAAAGRDRRRGKEWTTFLREPLEITQ